MLSSDGNSLVAYSTSRAVLREPGGEIPVGYLPPCFSNFIVYTGYDNNCIPTVISGGDGCIGALSNVYPSLCAEVAESLRKEDLSQIVKAQRSIDERMRFYEVYTPFNPVMKWAMAELGIGMQENCKAPLTALTEDTKASLSGFADQLWRNK